MKRKNSSCSCIKVLTFRSPEMFAPARMPVAAGKNTAKRRKKLSIPLAPPRPRKSGTKFVTNNCPIMHREQ